MEISEAECAAFGRRGGTLISVTRNPGSGKATDYARSRSHFGATNESKNNLS